MPNFDTKIYHLLAAKKMKAKLHNNQEKKFTTGKKGGAVDCHCTRRPSRLAMQLNPLADSSEVSEL